MKDDEEVKDNIKEKRDSNIEKCEEHWKLWKLI